MTLTTDRELTNQIASLKKLIPDVISKDFTRERKEAIESVSMNYNLNDKISKFGFTDLKIEKKFTDDFHHWGANKKIMDKTTERQESRNRQFVKIVRKLQSPNSPGSKLIAL